MACERSGPKGHDQDGLVDGGPTRSIRLISPEMEKYFIDQKKKKWKNTVDHKKKRNGKIRECYQYD